jgi:NADPH-dependent 2,4-dienoyl-CoA reductase/sulfur reductase-like enzyme
MPETIQVDVAVVGAGPAGLAAAGAAARHGASVVLIDENPAVGGQIWRGTPAKPHPQAARRAHALPADVRVLPSASVFDIAPPTGLLLETPRGVCHVRARSVILATGARERFLPFPGWPLPNAMGVGGLQAMVKAGLDVRGRRVVVAGTGPLMLAVADALLRYGAEVPAIFEQADRGSLIRFGQTLVRHPAKLLQSATLAPALRRLRTGRWVTQAYGRDRIEAVEVTDGRRTERIACDYLACAYGLVPNVELATALGCRATAAGVEVDDRLRTSVPNVFAVGEALGVAGVDAAEIEGEMAGLVAAGQDAEALAARRRHARAFGQALEEAFSLREELKSLARPDTVVCRCEDVRHDDLASHAGSRHAKLHSRCGMGPCQGRICGPANEFLFGWTPGTVRPPIKPVSIETLCEGYGEAVRSTTKEE